MGKNKQYKTSCIWLSLNPVWENTATKMVRENGKVRKLTKEEQHKTFGLYRFVLPFIKEKLCSWGKYKYKSNTFIETYIDMENTGISQDANPKEWFASFEDIILKTCLRCEVWNGNEWELKINFESKG